MLQRLGNTEYLNNALTTFFDDERLRTLGEQSNFIQRRARKITAKNLLMALCQSVLDGAATLTAIASNIARLHGDTVSKQAVCERMDASLIRFLQEVLRSTITERLRTMRTDMHSVLRSFKRILLQDSTCIQVPARLAHVFPGNGKGNQLKELAVAKIQAVYELWTETFCHFALTSFRQNDQSAAPLLEFLRPGDLLIRDLGYFVLSTFKSIVDRGAFFLSRYKFPTFVLDPHTAKQLNLLRLLRHARGIIDCDLLLGADLRLPVRLVAFPVDESVARERRKTFMQRRKKGCAANREHLALMRWSIFVTNVGRDVLSSEQIAALYGLRWRIEILFKAWKSHFKAFSFHASISPWQAEALFYATLILITLFHQIVIFPLTCVREHQNYIPRLSVLRLAGWFRAMVYELILSWRRSNDSFKTLSYYYRYEDRSRPSNYYQKRLCLT